MNRRGTTAAATFAGAALVGLAGGWWLAQSYDRTQKHRLFAPSAWRRRAALGFLERQGSVEAIPLLRDYLAWEFVPVLRARGHRILAHFEAALG